MGRQAYLVQIEGKSLINDLDLSSSLADVDVARNHNVLAITYTEVTDTLKGQGAGKQLIRHVVEYSRAADMKVILQCPFARKLFETNPDYHDVLEGGIL